MKADRPENIVVLRFSVEAKCEPQRQVNPCHFSLAIVAARHNLKVKNRSRFSEV